jgi:AcrR family transcriptional regulator
MARSTGRPRASGAESPSGLGTRSDILLAGARLFCTVGYGSTSTHAIATAAGIRQSTMYHYFAGKHEILLELLLGTVQPSLEAAKWFLARTESPAIRLWALCVSDVRLLSSGDANVGSLYLLPELSDPRLETFAAQREQLRAAYRELVASSASVSVDMERTASLVLGLVESVILLRRRSPESIDAETAPAIADAALRVIGLDDAAVRRIRVAGQALLDVLPTAD